LRLHRGSRAVGPATWELKQLAPYAKEKQDMNRTAISTARRFALTLTVAGAAALGSVAIAPAASAAPVQDGPSYMIEGNGNGPEAFIVTQTGRIPVFFCEDVQPGKDGVVDAKDMARAAKKAADETKKAADEADRAAKKAADVADKAAKDADKAAFDANKDVREAARKAADQAAKDAQEANKAAQEIVDRVMKQHNICLNVTGPTRF
jgi:hypothetical protein